MGMTKLTVSADPNRDGVAPSDVAPILERAKQIAVEYYRATGKPLGVTGEVGEYEAARLLGLKLAGAREPGFDASGNDGKRYQIKARALSETSRRKSQQLGSIKLGHTWDAVLFILMDEYLTALEIWEADRVSVQDALTAPGSRARNERGSLAMSKFKQIGKKVWPK